MGLRFWEGAGGAGSGFAWHSPGAGSAGWFFVGLVGFLVGWLFLGLVVFFFFGSINELIPPPSRRTLWWGLSRGVSYKHSQFSPTPMAFFSSDEKNPRVLPIPVTPGSLPPGFSPFKPALVHALVVSQCWVPP